MAADHCGFAVGTDARGNDALEWRGCVLVRSHSSGVTDARTADAIIPSNAPRSSRRASEAPSPLPSLCIPLSTHHWHAHTTLVSMARTVAHGDDPTRCCGDHIATGQRSTRSDAALHRHRYRASTHTTVTLSYASAAPHRIPPCAVWWLSYPRTQHSYPPPLVLCIQTSLNMHPSSTSVSNSATQQQVRVLELLPA